jgi:hypothetical protein
VDLSRVWQYDHGSLVVRREPTRARVRAEVVTEGRSDRAIEQVVGRLSLEPGVSEASWRIADPATTD